MAFRRTMYLAVILLIILLMDYYYWNPPAASSIYRASSINTTPSLTNGEQALSSMKPGISMSPNLYYHPDYPKPLWIEHFGIEQMEFTLIPVDIQSFLSFYPDLHSIHSAPLTRFTVGETIQWEQDLQRNNSDEILAEENPASAQSLSVWLPLKEGQTGYFFLRAKADSKSELAFNSSSLIHISRYYPVCFRQANQLSIYILSSKDGTAQQGSLVYRYSNEDPDFIQGVPYNWKPLPSTYNAAAQCYTLTTEEYPELLNNSKQLLAVMEENEVNPVIEITEPYFENSPDLYFKDLTPFINNQTALEAQLPIQLQTNLSPLYTPLNVKINLENNVYLCHREVLKQITIFKHTYLPWVDNENQLSSPFESPIPVWMGAWDSLTDSFHFIPDSPGVYSISWHTSCFDDKLYFFVYDNNGNIPIVNAPPFILVPIYPKPEQENSVPIRFSSEYFRQLPLLIGSIRDANAIVSYKVFMENSADIEIPLFSEHSQSKFFGLTIQNSQPMAIVWNYVRP